MSDNTNDINLISNKLNFKIIESGNIDLDSGRYKKIDCDSEQAMYISTFIQQIPAFFAADSLANSYKIVFPDGVQGTLMKYKATGGLGTPIQGENGKIVGHASLFQNTSQAVILGVFSILSIVTGQYFLTEINSKMEYLNRKIDQIMEFLYGDKKAELIAEINFIQYAQRNYTSIMSHESQKIATITGIQEAYKTAMKDIEFYMTDLSSKVGSSEKDFRKFNMLANKALRVLESLELSKQLFVMSSIMEAYYSQNFDRTYINSISETVAYYINKCDKRILGDFRVMRDKINNFRDSETVIELKNKFDSIINSLDGGDEAPILHSMSAALNAATQSKEYFLTKDGEIYIKAETA